MDTIFEYVMKALFIITAAEIIAVLTILLYKCMVC